KLGGRDPYPSKMAVLHGDHLRAPDLAQTALPSAAAPPSAPPPAPSPERVYVPPPPLPEAVPPSAAATLPPPELQAARPVQPTPPPEPPGPKITTAVRSEPRPARGPGKAPIIAAVAVIAIMLTIFVSAQVRKADAESKVLRSKRLIAETKTQLD